MAAKVNWKALEDIGEKRILDALRLALAALDCHKSSMAHIARETGIPRSSLSSIKCHGPYAHRNNRQTKQSTV